jgi:hypothetical protein
MSVRRKARQTHANNVWTCLLLCRNIACYTPVATNGWSKLPIASKPCKPQQTNFALSAFSEVRHSRAPIGPGPPAGGDYIAGCYVLVYADATAQGGVVGRGLGTLGE